MAKYTKPSKGTSETEKKELDGPSQKRGRGRAATVPPAEIVGRADNYRFILNQVWERLWARLSEARTEEEVSTAFREGANPYASDFVPGLSKLALATLHERTFPKRRKSRINFLADSLAGIGVVTARRSRDICAKERARQKGAHHILRFEFYIECSCRYKGQSINKACPKCGARIQLDEWLHMNTM